MMLRKALALIPLFFVIGCANVGSLDALCHGTETARREHAAALAVDGSDREVVTGARLIASIDAACD